MNLDPSLKLINCEQISEGTNNETAVYPKKVVKSALRNNACSVIVAHNHPDGKAIPSGKDIASTAKIKNALAAVDIPLNDHIIVSKDGYYSFGQNNML